jgi:cellulose synthase/poly-beta-1,6-N-acetylglucosamine synthase-like glycosyltransferase
VELVFVASALLCAYTYIGYPALLALLAALRPLRMSAEPAWTPHVTACMAVHNGAPYLRDKIASMLAQDYPANRLDVLVYTDGCTDDSVAVLRELASADPRIRVIEAAQRAGKPTALNRMRTQARGEVLLMTDVRQPLEPGCTGRLVALLADPAVGCVSGNLVLPGTTGAGLYWRYENWIRLTEARFRGMVGVTGPIYAVRRADLDAIPEDTILDDMWIPLRLGLQGRRLLFCADAIARDAAFDDEREFGRKVRTLAGNYQVFARMPALLSPAANPAWFETFSHKVCRLLCPWGLLALFGSTAVLALERASDPGTFGILVRGAAVAEAAFLVLAVLGGRAGSAGRVARTFVVLNAAAVVGLWRHLRGRQRITW